MPSPGPIVLGALIGVGAGAIASLPLLALGVADTTTIGGQTVLITLGFAAQFVAGLVAAHLAGSARALTGGLAGLVAHLIVAIVALASPAPPSLVALASGAVVALVLGTSAGVLVEARGRE